MTTPEAPGGAEFELRLYIAGASPRSARAVQNITRICTAWLAGRYHLEVVDVLDDPARAVEDDIIALPTLVRAAPTPVRKIIGDLSDTRSVFTGLEILSSDSGGDGAEPDRR